MHPLDERFREQCEASIDSNGAITLGGVSYDPVELLERLGQDAYKKAYDTWQAEDWLPIKQDQVKEWIYKYDCLERFENLCDALKLNSVIPYVGAGMSVPSGFCMWGKALERLHARSTLPKARFDELIAIPDFELAALEISENIPPAAFEESFQSLFPDRNDHMILGSVRYLPAIFNSNDVVTANFDRILERVYRQYDSHGFPEVVWGDRLSAFQRLNSEGRQCLIKIHGDRSWQDFRALNKTEYEALYAIDGMCTELLTRLFGSRVLLFLGCSLNLDRPMQIFQKLSVKTPGNQRHYAFLHAPPAEERIAREHWLAERSIFPIWYEGDHDECLEAIFTVILDRLGRL